MKHQGTCGSDVIHTETCLYDRYLCISCGYEWTKRKRRRAGMPEDQCGWKVPCAAHPPKPDTIEDHGGRHVEYPETHEVGNVVLHNIEEIQEMLRDRQSNDFGVQIANDGRVWICVNGIALIRFKPDRKKGDSTA